MSNNIIAPALTDPLNPVTPTSIGTLKQPYSGPSLFDDSGTKITANTSAPQVGVSTPSQLPKPTSVVSTTPAVKQASQIQTTVNNQTTANQTFANTPSSTNDVRDPVTGLLMNPPGAKYDRNTGALLNQDTSTGAQTGTSAEDKIANSPDEGMQEAYNLQTGQRQDQPIGTLPSGYSSQNPSVRTDVSDTATDSNGIQYKQFSDGTYGRFDEQGNYSAATASSFQAAKDAQGVSDKIQSILNGTFQLPPNQQAQLDGLFAKYGNLIQQQQTENANVTGSMTLAQNMYGMGNTLSGQGEVTKTINDGLQKVQELQFELANGLATMQDAFQKDDYSMLKDTYDTYVTNQKSIQTEIDKQNDYLQKVADQQQATIDNKNMNYALQQAAKYGDAGILPTDTPAQVDAKKQSNSAVYQFETNTQSGGFNQNALDGMLLSYNKTGVVPSFGFGATARPMREAFWAAVAGTPSTVDNATLNKAALKASSQALDTQQNQYSAAQTSIGQMKQSLGIAASYEDKLDKTGSPIINQYLQWLQGKVAGNADITAVNTAITTAANEYARILSGASASIAGTTVSSASEAKDLLNAAMSKGQFSQAMTVMQQDANARLTAQKGTIDSIKNDIKDLGTPDTSSSSGSVTSGFGWSGQ